MIPLQDQFDSGLTIKASHVNIIWKVSKTTARFFNNTSILYCTPPRQFISPYYLVTNDVKKCMNQHVLSKYKIKNPKAMFI